GIFNHGGRQLSRVDAEHVWPELRQPVAAARPWVDGRAGTGRLAARLGLAIVGGFAGILLAEAAIRLTISERTFWPVSNIFRAVETPGVGYTLIPNLRATAFGVDLSTNHWGFRGPEWSVIKEAGTFRIALIGDSHAFGYGVPFSQTVGERLSLDLELRWPSRFE